MLLFVNKCIKVLKRKKIKKMFQFYKCKQCGIEDVTTLKLITDCGNTFFQCTCGHFYKALQKYNTPGPCPTCKQESFTPIFQNNMHTDLKCDFCGATMICRFEMADEDSEDEKRVKNSSRYMNIPKEMALQNLCPECGNASLMAWPSNNPGRLMLQCTKCNHRYSDYQTIFGTWPTNCNQCKNPSSQGLICQLTNRFKYSCCGHQEPIQRRSLLRLCERKEETDQTDDSIFCDLVFD